MARIEPHYISCVCIGPSLASTFPHLVDHPCTDIALASIAAPPPTCTDTTHSRERKGETHTTDVSTVALSSAPVPAVPPPGRMCPSSSPSSSSVGPSVSSSVEPSSSSSVGPVLDAVGPVVGPCPHVAAEPPRILKKRSRSFRVPKKT